MGELIFARMDKEGNTKIEKRVNLRKTWRGPWMKFIKRVYKLANELGNTHDMEIALIPDTGPDGFHKEWAPRIQIDELSAIVESGNFDLFVEKAQEIWDEVRKEMPALIQRCKEPGWRCASMPVSKGVIVGYGFPSIPEHEKRFW